MTKPAEFPPTPATKICGRCKQEKATDQFYTDKRRRDGICHWCKDCLNTYYKNRKKAIKKSKFLSTEQGLKKIDIIPRSMKKSHFLSAEDKNPEETLQFYKGCFYEGYKKLFALGIPPAAINKIFGCNNKQFQLDGRQAEKCYQDALAQLQARLASEVLLRAVGYKYTEEEIFFEKEQKGKVWRRTKKKVHKKQNLGSPELLIFYLTNKFPELWKISRELVTRKGQTYDDDPGIRDRKKIIAIARGVLEKYPVRTTGEHLVQEGSAPVSGDNGQADSQQLCGDVPLETADNL